ncbi:MAG: PAS domain S-box protein, partial [Rhodospirillales bacterium]|nr:PAS domain S-box protein [Rhodospirillales bacterium]
PDRPLGVLSAHTKTPRVFSEDDILFLKTVAIMLASAISRKRAADALRAGEERLRGAIESMQEGFILFDAEDRVVMVNDVYRRINPYAQEFLEKRATFEDLIRANIQRGIIADAVGREDEFIRERLEQHRNPKGSIVRRHTDGRWYIIKETRTPEGGIAVTFSDVTELKRTDEALRNNREQLRAVIDNSPSAVTLKGRDGHYLLVNRTFASWMAAKPEDIVGRSVSDLNLEHEEMIRKGDQLIQQTGEINTFEARARYPDGVTRDLLISKGPVRSATREIVSVCTVITDVTNLRRADRELRETQEYFQIVVDNLPMAVNIKSRDGRYVMVNKQFEEWHRVSASEVIGKLPEEVPDLLPTASPIQNAHHKAVVDTRTVITRPLRISRPDGKMHDREVTKFPVLDAKGEVRLIGTVTADVTERKRAEQKLAELQAELAHVSRISTMGEMAAGLAHELNQPLTAITNYAKGTLRRLHAGGGDSVDLLPIMELVAEQALRAGDIIRKIRGFMNRSEPKKTRIDLRTTIDEVMSLLAGEINMSGIEVAVEVPTVLPPVMADSIQVQQVLLNLIRNAVAAMNSDGANHHRLEIGAKAEGAGEVEIFVKDNGPGVPSDIVGRLFEPFFTTKTDGLGMGLSISRSIVTGHRGRIWFSSEGDEGASFHFTLPTGTGGKHVAP